MASRINKFIVNLFITGLKISCCKNKQKKLRTASFKQEKCKKSQKYLLFPPSKTTICIICIFILHTLCIFTTINYKLSLIIQILFIFPWRFHIFIVILQPQTYKNTSHEGKE